MTGQRAPRGVCGCCDGASTIFGNGVSNLAAALGQPGPTLLPRVCTGQSSGAGAPARHELLCLPWPAPALPARATSQLLHSATLRPRPALDCSGLATVGRRCTPLRSATTSKSRCACAWLRGMAPWPGSCAPPTGTARRRYTLPRARRAPGAGCGWVCFRAPSICIVLSWLRVAARKASPRCGMWGVRASILGACVCGWVCDRAPSICIVLSWLRVASLLIARPSLVTSPSRRLLRLLLSFSSPSIIALRDNTGHTCWDVACANHNQEALTELGQRVQQGAACGAAAAALAAGAVGAGGAGLLPGGRQRCR